MPDWLTANPVAHRGLHNAAAGVIENTASAFAAAIAGGYAIECDLQISADGEAMVHHDDSLGRLTDGKARLDALTAAELKRVPYKATADRMLTLGELFDLVAGKATLVLELKSRFDGDLRLSQRATKILACYAGPAAVMSFDPTPIAELRRLAPSLRRGLVAQRRDTSDDEPSMPAGKFVSALLMARLNFLAYRVRDLDDAYPRLARLLGRPLLTWTVRRAADREFAKTRADQIIFEGFRP